MHRAGGSLARFALFLALAVAGQRGVAAEPAPATSASAPKNWLPDLNLRIVRFCESKLGEKVGSGECAALASESLKASGGTARRDLPAPPKSWAEDDYMWGTLLKPDDRILPGDILQFRDVEMKYHYPDGGSRTQRMPHHTAIVYKLMGAGKYMVLHQNIGPNGATDEQKRKVKADPLDLSAMQRGKIWAYRPVPRESKEAE